MDLWPGGSKKHLRKKEQSRICENDVARTTLWAWLYFTSSCTSEESVDITLVYEDDKTNWPTKSSFAFLSFMISLNENIFTQPKWKWQGDRTDGGFRDSILYS